MTLAQQFRQEGHQEGQLLGERLLLERQLTRKFGRLDEQIQEKLTLASQQELERWSEQVLDADTLDQVFDA